MRSILSATAALIALAAAAQAPGCGFDAFNTALASPARTAAFEAADRAVLRATTQQQRGTAYTVPVVFHLVHSNGPENVPDSVLQQAIDQVNLRYQNTAPFVDTTGHVVPITFCLASVDPFGQPTSGITRHVSALTVNAMSDGPAVKNIARWDPYRYLNVWVVRTITDPNVGGYSSFPADLGTAYDGIVIEAIGLPGGYLLSHEAGHYLGLYHTFQGGCTNFNCALDGDHVCDTPPDATNNWDCGLLSCTTATDDTTGLGPFTTDVAELPDYMDYSGCLSFSFTQGQCDRMAGFMATARTALTTSYACGANAYGPPPIATVLVDSSACTGRITFTNTTPGADFVQWDSDLTGPGWDATGNTISVDYPYTGDYSMAMVASTAHGTDTALIHLHVRVAPTPYYPIASGYQALPLDPWEGLLTACPGQALSFTGEPGMASYTWSTGSHNDSITFQATAPFGIHLTAVDANGLAWTNCALDPINVHQPTPLTSNVADTVSCGTPVTYGLGIPAYPAGYMWYQNGQVLSGPVFDYSTTLWQLGWNDVAVRLIDNVGCSVWTNTVSHYVAPTVPPVITQVGNDLVLDHTLLNMNWYTAAGVPLFTMDVPATLVDAPPGCYYVAGYDCAPVVSDTVCVQVAGIATAAVPRSTLAPNPAGGTITLTTASAEPRTATLVDAQGRLVRRFTTAGLRTTLDLHDLVPGAYTLNLADGEVLRFVRMP